MSDTNKSDLFYYSLFNVVDSDGKQIAEISEFDGVILHCDNYRQTKHIMADSVATGNGERREWQELDYKISYNPDKTERPTDRIAELFGEYPNAEFVFMDIVTVETETSEPYRKRGGLMGFRAKRGGKKLGLLVDFRRELNDPETGEEFEFVTETAGILKNAFDNGELSKIKMLANTGEQIPEDSRRFIRTFTRNMNKRITDLFYRQILTGKTAMPEPGKPGQVGIPPFKQVGFSIPDKFIYPASKTFTAPFKYHYTDEDLENGEVTFNVREGKTPDGKPVINYFTIHTEKPLDFFQRIIYSAYYSYRELYPDQPVPIVDLANMIHRSPNGQRIRGNSAFAKQIEKDIDQLRKTIGDLDFSEQAESYKHNDRFKSWVEEGNELVFMDFNVISANKVRIKKQNGTIVDGYVSSSFITEQLIQYLILTGQNRTVFGDVLINPLRASRDNDSVFHYLLLRVANMPYGSKTKILPLKQKIIDGGIPEPIPAFGAVDSPVKEKSKPKERTIWREEKPEPSEPEQTESENEIIELEAKQSLQTEIAGLMTKYTEPNFKINVQTIIDETSVSANSRTEINRLNDKIKTILDEWTRRGYIAGYNVNMASNGKTIQSYTIKF